MLAHPGDSDHPSPEPERTTLLATLGRRWQGEYGDTSEALGEVSSATLAIFGQEDRLVSRTAGHAWKERMPNCSLSYVYDAGHAIAIDRPDALLNVVLDFVRRRETFIVESRSGLVNP